jgi:CheY-like chemotaxis protein
MNAYSDHHYFMLGLIVTVLLTVLLTVQFRQHRRAMNNSGSSWITAPRWPGSRTKTGARTAADVAAPLAKTPADAPARARLAGLHLLVVDDSAMNREVIIRMLALEGARATPAEDGRQALDILRAQPQGFAAVLMDIPWLAETPLERVSAATAGPLDAAQFADRLAALRAALATNRPRPARQLFAELAPGLVQVYGAEAVQSMSRAMDGLRFDEVLRALGGEG